MPSPLGVASAALGRPLRAAAGKDLGGSDRSGIVRASDGGGTVVVKAYAEASRTSWARERVGLAVAGPLGLAPRLLAVAENPHLVVMEDLGSAPSVADHLLGSDPASADAALVAWATSLGRLHAGTHADRVRIADTFTEAEAAAAGDEPVDRFHAGVSGSLEEATAEWATHAEALGISGPPDVRALAAPLADESHHALSPADVCPDNNLLLADGCRLIDFEWSEVRHPAWDAAYLTVPWPTCWCAWRLPDDVATHALDAYRTVAAEGIPYVATDAFAADVETARVCWALVSVSWSLPHALREEHTPSGGGPSTRPRIQHRLALVSGSGTGAAAFATEVLDLTRSRWGDLALGLVPAYH